MLECDRDRRTGPAPTLAVIWLHGLGADGHDFEPIVPELGLRLPVRFVFPHAPVRPVTINGGMAMRAWYDILGFDRRAPRRRRRHPRERGRRHASSSTAKSSAACARERIVLAGFSQGGAIALHTALREPRPLAGVLALSTYLPLAEHARGRAQRCQRAACRSSWPTAPPTTCLPLVARGVLAPRARSARLRRRLARVSDGALGLHRGSRRDRRVARGVAGRRS